MQLSHGLLCSALAPINATRAPATQSCEAPLDDFTARPLYRHNLHKKVIASGIRKMTRNNRREDGEGCPTFVVVEKVELTRVSRNSQEEAEARAAATVEAAGEKVARDSAVLRQELESERAALIASLSEVEAAKVAAEQDAGTLRTRRDFCRSLMTPKKSDKIIIEPCYTGPRCR